LRRPRRRDDLGQPLAFDVNEHRRGDGLDLGHDQMRPFLLDDGAQAGRVGHRDDVRTMRHLHARRVSIAIDGNDFDAESLKGDDHFLAEFAGAKQHDAGGRRAERGSDTVEMGKSHGGKGRVKEVRNGNAPGAFGIRLARLSASDPDTLPRSTGNFGQNQS
jgi:hypothetical protein